MITKATTEQVYKLVQRYIPEGLFTPDEYERLATEPWEEDGDVNKTPSEILNYYEAMLASADIDKELKFYLNKAVDAIVRGDVQAELKWFKERGIELGKQ